MANKRPSELAAAASLAAGMQFVVSVLSTTVTKTATTISFAAADKSINDSGNGLIAAGFVAGDQVKVTGAANGGNNVFSATGTVVSAGKITTNAGSIVNEAAGANVTITKWESRRLDLATLLAALGPSVSVQTVGSAATVTPLASNDLVEVTAQAAALAMAAPSGAPVNGWGLVIRIKDDGTAQSITWDAAYRAIGVTLPATTVAGKQHYIGAVYNSSAAKWDVMSVGVEA